MNRLARCGSLLGLLAVSACAAANVATPGSPPAVSVPAASPAPGPVSAQAVAEPAPVAIAPPPAATGGNDLTLGTGANITVVGSSGNDNITLGAPSQSVIAGAGLSTVNLTPDLAGAKVVGSGRDKTTLVITSPGAAALSDADRDLTVRLMPGTNNLALGGGANITAVGMSGADTITVGASSQAVIAGTGSDRVNATADLAGVPITGNSQATTTLAITTGGRATLNNADSNITVVLGGGAASGGGGFAQPVRRTQWNGRSSRRWRSASVVHRQAASAADCKTNLPALPASK